MPATLAIAKELIKELIYSQQELGRMHRKAAYNHGVGINKDHHNRICILERKCQLLFLRRGIQLMSDLLL